MIVLESPTSPPSPIVRESYPISRSNSSKLIWITCCKIQSHYDSLWLAVNLQTAKPSLHHSITFENTLLNDIYKVSQRGILQIVNVHLLRSQFVCQQFFFYFSIHFNKTMKLKVAICLWKLFTLKWFKQRGLLTDIANPASQCYSLRSFK